MKQWPSVSFHLRVGVATALLLAWLVVLTRTMWYHDMTKQRKEVYKEGSEPMALSLMLGWDSSYTWRILCIAGAWKVAFSFLSNDAFLFIVMTLFDLLRCGYVGELQQGELSLLNFNSTAPFDDMTRVLRENSRIQCWQGVHLPLASAAIASLLWYNFTAVAYQNYVLLSRFDSHAAVAPWRPPRYKITSM